MLLLKHSAFVAFVRNVEIFSKDIEEDTYRLRNLLETTPFCKLYTSKTVTRLRHSYSLTWPTRTCLRRPPISVVQSQSLAQ